MTVDPNNNGDSGQDPRPTTIDSDLPRRVGSAIGADGGAQGRRVDHHHVLGRADLFAEKRKEEAAAAFRSESLDGVSLIGSRRHGTDRFAAFASAGLDMLNVTLGGETLDERVHRLQLVKELTDSL
ncbi:hypothetical protein [Cumulibacter soli]|uniref:hypothetical protein n=1 Tax=Cumulibacter soli TaxID=2546344 RepID=UPI001FBBAA84|nr:hypothetical protein [Cumulibacter soli]